VGPEVPLLRRAAAPSARLAVPTHSTIGGKLPRIEIDERLRESDRANKITRRIDGGVIHVPDDTKDKIVKELQESLELGTDSVTAVQDVADHYGIARETLKYWARQRNLVVPHMAGTGGGTVISRDEIRIKDPEVLADDYAWEKRRPHEADEAGRAAEKARITAVAAMEQRDARLAQSSAIVYGIFIDKAQLLTGKATKRTGKAEELSDEEMRERAKELAQKLAERDELTKKRTTA
jgi:hypothetical protein